MTGKRVGGIQKFALLIALGALLPATAAAQEPLPSTTTASCWDPWSAADFICDGFVAADSLFFENEKVCRAYCKRVAVTCYNHVVMTTRCLDRVNKDALVTWDALCGNYSDPADRKECQQENALESRDFRASLLVSQALGKDLCRDCYEYCIDFYCGDS